MFSDFVITGIISLRIAEYGEFSNLWNSHPKFLGAWPHGLKFKKIENSPESAIDNEIFPVQANFERKIFFLKNVNKQLKSADFLSEMSKFQNRMLNNV